MIQEKSMVVKLPVPVDDISEGHYATLRNGAHVSPDFMVEISERQEPACHGCDRGLYVGVHLMVRRKGIRPIFVIRPWPRRHAMKATNGCQWNIRQCRAGARSYQLLVLWFW